MASIKLLTTLLVFVCVVATGLLCTVLAVTSADKALTDTKDSRDESVNRAFSVGEAAVENRTREFAQLTAASAGQYILSFLEPFRRVARSRQRDFAAYPWSEVSQWSFLESRRTSQWGMLKEFNELGMSGLGVVLDNYAMMLMYEDESTIQNPPGGYHFYGVEWNYGVGTGTSVPGGVNLTVADEMNPMTAMPKTLPPFSYQGVNWDFSTCTFAYKHNGTVPHEPCVGVLRNPKSDVYLIGYFLAPGEVKWTAPVQGGEMIILVCAGAYYDTSVSNTFLGINFAMVDLRQVSKFLRELQIGRSQKARVYTTVKQSWMDPSAGGLMTGASSGTAYFPYVEGVGVLARRPHESDDFIINGLGSNLTAEHYQNLSSSGEMLKMMLPSEPNAAEEEFFIMVAEIEDGHGIEWYVTVAIDRESVLATIDQSVLETRADIEDKSQKVEDNLSQARMVTYLVVAVCAVGLISVGVWLVLLINAPLMELEKDMAAVAMMRLEDVPDHRMSSLTEVRSMQISFQQMIANLVEFRNFMPASVLQSSASDDDDGDTTVTSGTKQSSLSQTFSKQTTPNLSAHLMPFEVRRRNITMLAANIVDFLSTPKQQDILETYLSLALSIIKTHRGLPDGFEGDRLYVSFNSVRPCSGHKRYACACALELYTGCRNIRLGHRMIGTVASSQELVTSGHSSVQLSIGVATGETKCGNMGVEGMKKFTYVGSLAGWFRLVERVGREHGVGVAIDNILHEMSKGRYFMRVLEGVLYVKHSEEVQLVWGLESTKTLTEEEWMYQLEEGEKQDAFFSYNSAFAAYVVNDKEKALELLDQSTAETAVTHVKNLREQIENGSYAPRKYFF